MIPALVRHCGQFLWQRRIVILAHVLIAVLLLGLAWLPRARAQIPGLDTAAVVSAISSITTAISNVIGAGLSEISGILTGIQNVVQAMLDFFNGIVYPRGLIDRARELAATIQGIFASVRGILNAPVQSATLANPRALETILLSKNPASISAVAAAFGRVYQAVPPPTQAPPEVRDLIDMSDAQAMASMKRSIAIDQAAEQIMNAADRISAELVFAAPGTAPMVEASAVALLVRAHAYTQSAMAELMRVRAIALANDSAVLKMSTAQAEQTRRTFFEVLRRK